MDGRWTNILATEVQGTVRVAITHHLNLDHESPMPPERIADESRVGAGEFRVVPGGGVLRLREQMLA